MRLAPRWAHGGFTEEHEQYRLLFECTQDLAHFDEVPELRLIQECSLAGNNDALSLLMGECTVANRQGSLHHEVGLGALCGHFSGNLTAYFG